MNTENVVRPLSAEPRMSAYINNRAIKLGFPASGTFEITSRCNFNCRMCYVHNSNSRELAERELTAEQWLRIAHDARDMGMIFLLLTGGEPMLREDFPDLYKELIQMGIMVSINTNASLYNDRIRELFNQYPPSRINVTLYGGSENTYQSLCGNASFARVAEHLRSMRDDKLQVRLNVTLTPYNISDMEQIDEISRELNLQAKTSSYMYPPVRLGGKTGFNCARFSPDEAGRAMAKWNYLRDSKEDFLRRAELLRQCADAGLSENCVDVEQEGIMCRAGRSSFWMTWDGKMTPCGTMNIPELDARPLEHGFVEAWKRVKDYTASIRMPRECSACPDKRNCSVCASICRSESGSFDIKPDYICAMFHARQIATMELADHYMEERTTNETKT